METLPDSQGLNRRDLFKLVFGGVAALFIPRPASPAQVKPMRPEKITMGFQPGYIPEQVQMMRDPLHPYWQCNPHMVWDPGHNHAIVDWPNPGLQGITPYQNMGINPCYQNGTPLKQDESIGAREGVRTVSCGVTPAVPPLS